MSKKKRAQLLSGMVLLLCLLLLIPHVEATSWSSWTTKAVGDVSESSLPTYWTITSIPFYGYESQLWSDWHSVIDSGIDSDFDNDEEIRFMSSTSQMGKIEFTSKMMIEDTQELIFRGQVACYFTWNQVRTLGHVKIFDTTSQTVVWSYVIESGSTPYSWYWYSFNSGKLSLNKDHDYVIKLDASDAWIDQQVRVVWESAEVWFHTPYYRTLTHGADTWRHEWLWHYYVCKWYSNFYFKQGPLDDMLRSHLPYVSGGGLPYGWNPCYLHEFRSVPYNSLEYDNWYYTNLPGSYGVTQSSEQEEQQDGYEEVEVYTRNPELIVASQTYQVQVQYTVWETGTVTMTLESELGNIYDLLAPLSAPAYPVAWMDIYTRAVNHAYKSYFGLFAATASSSHENVSTSTLRNVPITYTEHHRWFDIAIVGIYPHFLKVYTLLNIKSNSDLTAFQEDMKTMACASVSQFNEDLMIPTTITFNGLATVDSVMELVERYDLDFLRFRFTAHNDADVIRGQGTSYSDGTIPVEYLEDFIEGYDLLGIQSIDVRVSSSFIESLMNEREVFTVDLAAFLSILNAGIPLDHFSEIQWYPEDASWYLSFFTNA